MALYALYEHLGVEPFLTAMAQADAAGTYNADAVALLVEQPATQRPVPTVSVLGLPAQSEVDRALSVYETWVQVEEAVAR